MHVLESYALGSGAKISKPDILEKFFPCVLGRYITLDTDNRSPSKYYNYWQEVVDILYPILKKQGIDILQLGFEGDQVLQNVYNTAGQASHNQQAYLIRNSLLHVGPDNLSTDLASSFDKKIVAIFGNCLPSHFKPYWSKDGDVVLLEPERKETKPCYANDENPKAINLVSPENIAKAVCKLLKIDFEYRYSYLFMGGRYPQGMINVIPDAGIDVYGQVPRMRASVRMDLLFNEEGLAKNLQLGKFDIVTNRPIDPQLITHFKQNINQITYMIEEDHNPNFIRFLMNSAVPYIMISFLPEEIINPIKLDYMDFGVLVEQKKRCKSEIEESLEEGVLYYKSNKFILSSGKIYPSQPAWKRGLNIPSFEKSPQLLIDEPTLWEEVDNYCILKNSH